MKKALSLFVIFALVLSMGGCSPEWKKKFVRKKKQPTIKVPKVHRVKKYEKRPSPELYKKHYVYWESWSSELIELLGQNHKKDVRCVEEALGHLKDMQYILVPEKGAELQVHIDRLTGIRDTIVNDDMGFANKDTIRRDLEREDRLVKMKFSPKDVRNFLKKSLDDENAGGVAESASIEPEELNSPLKKGMAETYLNKDAQVK